MSRTEFLLIGTIQRLSNLSENQIWSLIAVQQVLVSKSLGVQTDENLN